MNAREFFGEAQNITFTGTVKIHPKRARVYRLDATIPGCRINVDLSIPLRFGGPVVYLINVGANSIDITDGSSPIGTLAVGQTMKVFIVDGLKTLAKMKTTGANLLIGFQNGHVAGGGNPASTAANQLAGATETWSALAAAPVARNNGGSFVAQSGLHLFGGGVNTCSRYNALGWTARATLPYSPVQTMGDSVNGQGYALSGASQTNVCKYNPLLNMWTSKTAIGWDRSRATARTVKDKIYVLSGVTIGSYSLYYDPRLDVWATIQGYSSTARADVSSFAADGLVFAVGGFNDASYYSADLESYNPETATWTTRASLGAARYTGVTFTVQRLGHYAGGRDNAGVDSNSAWYFNLGSLAWVSIASYPASIGLFANHGGSFL